jgi:hypothetical protein
MQSTSTEQRIVSGGTVRLLASNQIADTAAVTINTSGQQGTAFCALTSFFPDFFGFL